MSSVEYTPEQKRAEELYLDSVCWENDYKPISYSKLVELLDAEGIKTSTSALGRWAKKFEWKEKVKAIVTAATVSDGAAKELIEKSSLEANTKKILTDFEANEKLKDDAYYILNKQMSSYKEKIEKRGSLSLDDTKIIIKILDITTLREDKLLDRQAMLAATKLLKSEDVLKELQNEVIDIEMEDE